MVAPLLLLALQASPGVSWERFGPEAFARAKTEHKLILLDGSASWCHWCHVMDDTTYRDPEVVAALREEFVAIRFDVDQHPELEERYGAWGWPATILLSADAEELGKYRGYLPPQELKGILASAGSATLAPSSPEVAPPVEALTYVAALAMHTADGYYDEEQGGWGMRKKAPLSANAEFELRRASHGDERARKRALQSLEAHRALFDPVWGGIYQYSAASDWGSPHFEKLMTYQASAIEAYAAAARFTGEATWRDDARRIAEYVKTFLRSEEGTFYVSQDADLGQVEGAAYYGKNDAGRRALGTPRVDTHDYPRENGLAIAALCKLGDLDAARTAADRMLATHVGAAGNVRRDRGPLLLADAAAFGRGLACLASQDARYRAPAVRIADAMLRNFGQDGPMWERTEDPDATGVFAQRRKPFVANVQAARFLASLGRAGEARAILAGVATPTHLEEEGFWVGEFLLALDESGAIDWARLRADASRSAPSVRGAQAVSAPLSRR